MKIDRWRHYASGRIEESNESCSLMVRDDGLKLYVAKVGASEEEMEAVARLFSLAHDLLEALEWLVRLDNDAKLGMSNLAAEWHDAFAFAKEKIARVKGESSES